MKRVMLRVAYDGTDYCGWQRQPNGLAVEEVINRELSALLGEPVSVIGASRTDSGVHALDNVCVFDTESRIPGEKFAYALNARLPQDIVVQQSCDAEADFHPRHCDCRKTYEYRIYNATFRNPLLSRYAHFLYRKLDAEAMRRAAGYLVGEHDFKSFCSVNTQVKETVRTIYSLDILEQAAGAGRLITIRVSGNGFLYNMVRIISGTLIEAGYHWREPETMPQILAARDRAAAGPTAPACGLTLMEICYL
ncbi:MAG: tRNA pseudouridine(38-40) synthase TruA [Lachnospiraceae bacterium]|nr:tRNA pseudouridine(38-40) synthase TruA [Lachnospiraceae bacterium]